MVCLPSFALGSDGLAAPTVNDDLAPDSTVKTLAGTGQIGLRDGPTNVAEFMLPVAVTYDTPGSVIVADQAAQRIRMIKNNIVSTVAGSGDDIVIGQHITGGYRDGPAADARFNEPSGVASDRNGNIYVADLMNHCIRKIDRGMVTTYSGSPLRTVAADGPKDTAAFSRPLALAVDDVGIIYVADTTVGVRRIDLDGTVTTISKGAARNVTSVSVVGSGDTATIFAVDSKYINVFDTATQKAEFYGDYTEGGDRFPFPFAILGVDRYTALISDTRKDRIGVFVRPDKLRFGSPRAIMFTGPPDGESSAAGLANGLAEGAKFLGPTGIATYRGAIAVADSANRQVRVVSLPDLRGSVSELVPNANFYNIAIVGASQAYFATLWRKSIPGRLEAYLRANRVALGGKRDFRVQAFRSDGMGVITMSQYLSVYAADGQADLVLWLMTPREVHGIALLPGKSEYETVSETLRTTKSMLAANGDELIVVVAPSIRSLSPAEDYFNDTEQDQFADSFAFDKSTSDQQALLDAVRNSDVASIDLTADLLRYEQAEHSSLLGLDAHHFSPDGIAVASHALETKLAKLHPWTTR
jgi:hypothetical protein